MNLHVQVLGSSSAGNCTAVWNDNAMLLVDCGFWPDYIQQRLSPLGRRLQSVTGVLITHTHRDHVDGTTVRQLLKAGVPLLAPEGVLDILAARYATVRRAMDAGLARPLPASGGAIGPFDVQPFGVPHDALGGCYAYAVFSDGLQGTRKVTIATDLAYPRNGLAKHFADSDVLVIESNHDIDMLEQSSRPAWLKQRIKETGHLSNDQCADFVVDVIRLSAKPPSTVVLAHISQECNTRPLAVERTGRGLDEAGWGSIPVLPTHRYAVTPMLTV
jgi:phosphoribosyl 1,2-cyclic phosphodiesterase